ncbi:hypothetical protein JRQ81_013051 [Phrynocephalus forsythii]|uniref:RUN and SH3 domain-containing protein 1 n=1 Tax=Phrynocephalus forsythii TaxID=171643 RepID=A0A9Q0XYD8_9SAUR|nr:hypothetical protein JRQ81_013051 [Phrynocephalus forsythii]
MRFNAFVFGLLNIRSLEFWFNHLYNHEDIIQVHYLPVGFLSLVQGACQGLFEEVLLLLQPLSLLPFSLDLLFEHRLLQKGKEQQQQKELLRGKQDLALSAHSTLQLMRTQESSPGGVAPSRDPRGHPAEGTALSVAGEGEGGRVKGVGAPSEGLERRAAGGGDGRPKAPPAEGSSEAPKDKQASWWYQLMRSSQVYIEGSAEGSRLGCYEQRKKAGAAPRQGEPRKGPPPREGVVEGAEACPITEGPLKGQPPRGMEGPVGEPLPGKMEAREKGRPFWMGSPPDSVLAELKQAAEESGSAPKAAGSPEESRPSAPEGSLPKWGHLFGSRKAPKETRQPNRLPSGWLSLDRSVFQLMAQTVGASMWREDERMVPDRAPVRPKQQPRKQPLTPGERSAALEAPCEVKALCHHLATEDGQLSFQKGDVLRVLSKVDADWLRCGRGAESGLVPIMYVTHREDEDY